MNLTSLGIGLATGIGLGSIYALIAVSLNLIVASTGYFIFVLESVVSIGGIGYRILATDEHLPLAAAMIIVAAGGAVVGTLLEFVVHRPFAGRARNVALPVLLASVGFAIAIDAGLSEVVGSDPLQAPNYISPRPLIIHSVTVNKSYIVMFVAVAVLAVALEVVFGSTDLGRRLRVLQADREGAALVGQNVKMATTAVFAVAGLLAAVAGMLVTPITATSPTVGSGLVIPAFAAIAIGGFGSFRGAIGGGLAVGIISGVLPLYAAPSFLNPALLGLIVVTLVVRPRGLFAMTASREL